MVLTKENPFLKEILKNHFQTLIEYKYLISHTDMLKSSQSTFYLSPWENKETRPGRKRGRGESNGIGTKDLRQDCFSENFEEFLVGLHLYRKSIINHIIKWTQKVYVIITDTYTKIVVLRKDYHMKITSTYMDYTSTIIHSFDRPTDG